MIRQSSQVFSGEGNNAPSKTNAQLQGFKRCAANVTYHIQSRAWKDIYIFVGQELMHFDSLDGAMLVISNRLEALLVRVHFLYYFV